MTQPLISVVIPLYNKGQWVKRCIASVIAQSCKNMEILIVNDGSTDNSLQVVTSISDPRIKIFDKSNSGVSGARNLGIKNAQGKYIALLDADDEWKPEHLEMLLEGFERFEDAIVICDDLIEVRGGQDVQKTAKRKLPFPIHGTDKNTHYFLIEDYLGTLRDGFFILSASSVLIRSSVLKEHELFFCETMTHGEDVNYWIRLSRYGKFVFCGYIGAVYYHVDTQSAMNRKLQTVQMTPDYFYGLPWNTFDNTEQKNIFKFLSKEYYKKAFQNRGLPPKKKELSARIGTIKLGYFPRLIYLFIRYCPENIFEFLKQMKKRKEK